MDKKLTEALYKVQALLNEKMLQWEMSDYNKLKEIEKVLVELIQDECRKSFKN